MQESTQPYYRRPLVDDSAEPTVAPAIETTAPLGPGASQGGALPANRYQVGEEIARGGMGIVLRAADLQLNRTLAIKVLLGPDSNGELARRFLEEARITGQLQHPGVAPVHEVGWLADGRPFFSMKLIEGQTLKSLLDQRGAPQDGLPRFLKVFEQVAQTLAYAHARGIIHRDLKPSNVMVGAFGEVQVMDWGLAKRYRQDDTKAPIPGGEEKGSTSKPPDTAVDDDLLTRAGQVIGTPAYMPPEQARGEIHSLDERSDVFGLGAILCEILTGQPPYSGERAALMEAAERGDLSAAHARLEACQADPELVKLARCCLAVEPATRPRDAGEVAAEIAGYLQSVEERLRKAELRHAELQVIAERRRQRLTAALATTAVAMILLLAGSAFWIQWQARKNELLQRQTETRGVVELALVKAQRSAEEAAQMPQRDSASAAAAAVIWRESMAGVEQAQAALRSGAGAEAEAVRLERLRREIEQGLAHAERAQRQFAKEEKFLDEIERARLARATWIGSQFDYVGSARRYEQAFANIGLAILDDTLTDSRDFMAAVKSLALPMREAIVVALDDWANYADLAEDSRSGNDLRTLAAALDDLSWRKELRTAAEKKDLAKLTQLAAEASTAKVPASTLIFLADHLNNRGQRALSLAVLRMARDVHPDDFWTHFSLAQALGEEPSSPIVLEERLGALRAALALRPNAAAAHNNMGNAYLGANRLAEAEKCYERAIAADPEFAVAYVGLARVWETRDLDKSVSLLQTAIAKYPDAGMAHNNLAAAYNLLGKQELAITHYRRAIECDPNLFLAHQGLGVELFYRGEFELGRLHLAKAAALVPKSNVPQFTLALLHLNRGEIDEALRRARLAVAASPQHAGTHEMFAEVQCSSGDFAGAVSSLRQALGLAAKGPEPPKYEWRNAVESKLAQYERYAALAVNLPEFMSGKRRLESASELLDLADVCGYRRQFAAAARQYARAFALEPSLLDSAELQHAYDAASAAALALEGRSENEPELKALDREELRSLALAWLNSELQAQRRVSPDSVSEMENRASLYRHRLADVTLRALRDSAIRGALPADEQQAWEAYWTAAAELSVSPQKSSPPQTDYSSIMFPRQAKWFPRPLPLSPLPPLELPTETNSLGMRLICIPAGTFMMGSTPADGDLANEIPHEVRIEQPFWLSAHEVTVAQFRQFATATGRDAPPQPARRKTWGFDERGYMLANRDYTWQSPGFPQGDNHPVCCVSWNDAAAFCKWLSEKEHCVYRLPTEAEWEYACRAGTRFRFFDEHGIRNITDLGNVSDASAREKFAHWPRYAPGKDGFVFTAPVGSFAPNRFGLYDMVGNVSEFCSDWHSSNPFLEIPAVSPRGPATGTRRVARGDGFNDRTRISHRFLLPPDRRQNNLGFRLVREVPQAK